MATPGFPDKYTQLWGHTPVGDLVDDDVVYPAGITETSPLEEAIQYSLENAGGATTEQAVIAALDGATLATTTPVSGDKFLFQDTSASDALVVADFDALIASGGGLIASVDAGGLAWNSFNPNWIDPAVTTEFTQLHVSNSNLGSQVWYRLTTAQSDAVWTQSA